MVLSPLTRIKMWILLTAKHPVNYQHIYQLSSDQLESSTPRSDAKQIFFFFLWPELFLFASLKDSTTLTQLVLEKGATKSQSAPPSLPLYSDWFHQLLCSVRRTDQLQMLGLFTDLRAHIALTHTLNTFGWGVVFFFNAIENHTIAECISELYTAAVGRWCCVY